ncbi:MAG: TonB family protein [Planctomycetales bacterium]|nr:TonB family protein [Planctomycetales bacterium]
MGPKLRTAWLFSAMFHIGLAGALAWKSFPQRDLGIRAGEDSVIRLTMAASTASAAQRWPDTPVVVTEREARIDTRRMVETAAIRELPRDVAPTDLVERLETPPLARRATAVAVATPASASATQPAPPLPKRPATIPPVPRQVPVEPIKPVEQVATPPRAEAAIAAVATRSRQLGANVERPVRETIVPPVFTDARPPVFPTEARRHGWSGTVMLTITVDERGQVTDVQVRRSSGYPALDASAVRAVKTWRGRPATRDGVPYLSQWNKPIRFE